MHLDVIASADQLAARGAVVLRPADDNRTWTVLADPEGNELCAFSPGLDRWQGAFAGYDLAAELEADRRDEVR